MIVDEHGRVDAERTADEMDFRSKQERDAKAEAALDAVRGLHKRPATPLPWHESVVLQDEYLLMGSDEGYTVQVADFESYSGPWTTSRDDLRYAVRACNAYPKLVEALKEVYKFEEGIVETDRPQWIAVRLLLRELGELK